MSDSQKGEMVLVHTKVNGREVEFWCDTRQSLLECLRDVLGMTGTKEACNDGNCGACAVILDGPPYGGADSFLAGRQSLPLHGL
jgi:aerobic-type carbon monoxide dehydrogenase small subunit (CoxS/CutS family)